MSDDALLSTPSGPGTTPPWRQGHPHGANHFVPEAHDHDEHQHYQRLRDEHARQLDDEYREWRRHRFQTEFEAWRNSKVPVAPRDESTLQTYGRAISSVVLGTQEPDFSTLDDKPRDTGRDEAKGTAPAGEHAQHARAERFFERS